MQGLVASFAKAHAKALVLVARNAAQLDEVAQDVRAIDSSIKVLTVAADITDERAVDALFDKVKSAFGTADVLVNNAGLGDGGGRIGEVDPKTWWTRQVRHLSLSACLMFSSATSATPPCIFLCFSHFIPPTHNPLTLCLYMLGPTECFSFSSLFFPNLTKK